MSYHIVLYGKPNCHLCHEAEAMLIGLEHEYALTITKVNILEDPQLETRYRYAIPVISVDGELELEAPILETELRAVFNAA